MALRLLPPVNNRISIKGLSDIADRAQTTLSNLRDDLLEPWPRKQAPEISVTRLAKLCRMDRAQINYLCTRGDKGNYPTGTLTGAKRTRMFTLLEAQDFIRANGPYRARPPKQKALVGAIGNFKGGVSKTTKAVTLAQGLTLHGHRVLLVDLDPQASATTLMGYVPYAEITEDMTVMPVVYGDKTDLSYAVLKSYWEGLDFIPAGPVLAAADYYLPRRQASDPNFEFWKVLDTALEPLRSQYDIIIIDTPPTLSSLTIGAFMATDALIVPVPPETLDYASSTQFFRQFSDLFMTLEHDTAIEKDFEFVKIVLSKVKSTAAATPIVRGWIKQTYLEHVADAEMIETDVVMNASAEFKTVYDLSSYDGSMKTLTRAQDSFDAVVDEMELYFQTAWEVRSRESELAA